MDEVEATVETGPAVALTSFVRTLWPEASGSGAGGDFVICSGVGTKPPDSFRLWRRTSAALVEGWAQDAVELGQTANVWFGVCLQRPGETGRGGAETATWAPGLWAEVDYGKPGAPPDLGVAWEILNGFAMRPTVAVHSGRGIHAYWLFDEPLALEGDGVRDRMKLALLGVNGKLRELAREAGDYGVDKVSDLARVLRLPGTFNHKREGERPSVVQLELEGAGRYGIEEALAWCSSLVKEGEWTGGGAGSGGSGGGLYGEEYTRDSDFETAAQWDKVLEGCSWARHAVEAVREEGSEPTWKAMLSVACRCSSAELGLEGEALCQELSMPFAGWDPDETRAKVGRALTKAGPVTCKFVESDLAWEGCSVCPSRGKVTSPIVLGRKGEAGEVGAALERTYENYEPDDNGIAWRFVSEFEDRIRWVPGGTWWAWDGSIWRQDHDGTHVGTLARELSLILRNDVAALTKDGGLDEHEDTRVVMGNNVATTLKARATALAEYARQAGSTRRMSSAANNAKYDPRIQITMDDFDQHPHVLNCSNGVVDLRTGELFPHSPGLLLTKRIDAAWREDARSERWEGFVESIMPDPVERRALQQLAGYTLCGETGERIAMFLYGVGDNGKSIFADTLLQLLKGKGFSTGYAQQAPEGFLARGRPASDRIPADLAMMHSARMVLVSELPTRLELASEFIKWVTGEGDVTARRMRENFFSFKVRFKLWVETNSRPKVKDTSNATWNRVLLIPFRQEFERVTGFKEEIQRQVLGVESAGMLQWCYAGYKDWREHGRIVPSEWQLERDELRNDDDVVKQLVDDLAVKDPMGYVRTADLYTAYTAWVSRRGGVVWSAAAFNGAVRDAGYVYARTSRDGLNNERCWKGLRLTEDGQKMLEWASVEASARATVGGWS